ncbi:MAG: asparagine synthase (glutamine-hydrolyzing) [Gammaproteobacteria bacterium]|nr:MAG: asparagine synthase (glutamine-hydrolyzing) [Gammaproteobacteria bacterium]
MCGINGIFLKDKERVVQRAEVVSMRDSMIHRGPDDEGIFVDRDLGLGHRRLSIIGITTGNQPMTNSGQTLWIVYNGETYNYTALRKLLEARGHRFETESDTEVVLNVYAEYGPDCVRHMNGFFAFAIWDSQKRQRFVARDRLGIKPLYFIDNADCFVFASEIKSILKSGYCDAAINSSAVYEFFVFRAVCGEQTLFDGVRSLLPGHRMTITENATQIEQYWDESSGGNQPISGMNDAVDRLDELLTDAVNIRLMSEVPLGTLCSGGVDSSLVTALAARACGTAINTYSVGFKEADFDESGYARLVSAEYGTKHHEVQLTGQQFAELLPDLVRLNDEPLNFANSVHIYAVSKLAKEHVTVVLTGEGADELFIGYPRYHLPRFAAKLDSVRWLASPILSAASAVFRDHRFKKLQQYLNISHNDRVLLNSAINETDLANEVLDQSVSKTLGYRRIVAHSLAGGSDVLSNLSINDQKTYLVSILNRQDKMSMAASVESRVPFLDYRIVEFANNLKSSNKTRGWDTKQIVKKVAARYLPGEVVHRRKSGFGVPLTTYFRDNSGLRQLAERLINESDYHGLLDKRVLLQRLDEHRVGSADNSELLWTAVSFLTWKEQYGV